MRRDQLGRPTVHALLTDCPALCLHAARPGVYGQLQGLVREMSAESLRMCSVAALPGRRPPLSEFL